jgi:hypothetical protein
VFSRASYLDVVPEPNLLLLSAAGLLCGIARRAVRGCGAH